MSHHAAHGIAVDLPNGWNAHIYRREAEDELRTAARGAATAVRGGATFRAATVPIDEDEADFGSRVVSRLGSDDAFVVLLEYTVDERLTPGEGLFAAREAPWPLSANDFRDRQLQVDLPGQLGLQRFFTVGERPFCLYAVVGSERRLRRQVRALNALLETVRIDALS